MNIKWTVTETSARTIVSNYDIFVYRDETASGRVYYDITMIDRNNSQIRYNRTITCDSVTDAMVEAHRIIELNPAKFISPNFTTLKKSIKGYKAVLIWNSKINHFGLRVIEVRIPKGTVVHTPAPDSVDYEEGMFKYRAQDAIITSKFANYEKGLSLFIGELIAQTYPRVWINDLVTNLGDHVRGYYSTGMKIHIPDFSWHDTECAAGFHYFLTQSEAERYLVCYYTLAAKLNDIITKEANNG